MKNVDYQKLSEQYASFLVAVGGVSITVLALILNISASAVGSTEEESARLFLILDLFVATVCCFIGAHMMAETAASISYSKEKLPEGIPLGKRLFILASINIFLAVILVLFALMELPSALKLSSASSIKSISFAIFGIVLAGVLGWLVLGALYRIKVGKSKPAIFLPLGIGAVICYILCSCPASEQSLLGWTFIPIVISTVLSLIYFTLVFKCGDNFPISEVCLKDVCFFSSTIAVSYAFIVAAAVRTYCGDGCEILNAGTVRTILDNKMSSMDNETIISLLYVFALAAFLGYLVISKVPPLLHTPLMSATNAISGISLVGAIVLAGSQHDRISTTLGVIAVISATINVVGGFMITDRMLRMFQDKTGKKK